MTRKEYMRQRSKEWYIKNKDKIKERSKQYYQDNKDHYKEQHKEYRNRPEIIQQYIQYDKIRDNTPERKEYTANKLLKKRCRCTLKYKKQLIIEQDNKCTICGDTFLNTKHTHMDHNHDTKQIRNVLCARCNHAVGNVKEDITIATKLVEYLKKWNNIKNTESVNNSIAQSE